VLALDLDDTQEPPTSEEGAVTHTRRPSEPLVPGDRYQLGTTIAFGGMGEVVTAHDVDIGRDVAIKRLRAPNPTPVALARFLREARIQGRLDHPAIVPVHELACDQEGRPFFAMKKLSGTTLSAILSSRSSRFTRHQLLRAFADVCLAIEFAHTRGVIHRDIKPANILLGDFGEVYVLDWGIARVPTDPADPHESGGIAVEDPSWTRPGSALGTPGYMSPEQARGAAIDARTDVYALGSVLFEILARRPLHPRGKDALKSTLRGVDARPSLYDPDVPPELDALCVRATTPFVEDRITSARELGEALQRYLDGDRDLALRNKLAREHLALALACGDDDGGRRIAMREAGQAIALDPTLTAAAELIGRLMLEPPKRMPAQVVDELAEQDRAAGKRFVWSLVVVHGVSFAMLPVLWLLGMRDGFYVGMMGAVCAAGFLAAVADLRLHRDLLWGHLAIMLFGFALLARILSPFLVAPALVGINVVAFAFHPRGRHPLAFTLFTVGALGAILCVWLGEVVGLLSPTMQYVGGTLMIHSPIDGIAAFPVSTALAVYVPLTLISSAAVSFTTARFARVARDRAHLQAWQVRQLVPTRRD